STCWGWVEQSRAEEGEQPELVFCSRRRRHTSFKCDWSSDVCSSDLGPVPPPAVKGRPAPMEEPARPEVREPPVRKAARVRRGVRSEERRVGTAGGWRWARRGASGRQGNERRRQTSRTVQRSSRWNKE